MGCTRTPAASRYGATVVDGRPFGDSEDGTTRGSTKSRRGSRAHPTPSTTITIPTSLETGTPRCGTTTLNPVESEIPAPSPTEFVGKTAAKIRWRTQSISLHTPDRRLTFRFRFRSGLEGTAGPRGVSRLLRVGRFRDRQHFRQDKGRQFRCLNFREPTAGESGSSRWRVPSGPIDGRLRGQHHVLYLDRSF